jgi:hypothetical protein
MPVKWSGLPRCLLHVGSRGMGGNIARIFPPQPIPRELSDMTVWQTPADRIWVLDNSIGDLTCSLLIGYSCVCWFLALQAGLRTPSESSPVLRRPLARESLNARCEIPVRQNPYLADLDKCLALDSGKASTRKISMGPGRFPKPTSMVKSFARSCRRASDRFDPLKHEFTGALPASRVASRAGVLKTFASRQEKRSLDIRGFG